jgi:hypothetical protein
VGQDNVQALQEEVELCVELGPRAYVFQRVDGLLQHRVGMSDVGDSLPQVAVDLRHTQVAEELDDAAVAALQHRDLAVDVRHRAHHVLDRLVIPPRRSAAPG